MRKLAVILVVAGLLGLAQAGQAGTINAGSYVNIGLVALWGTDQAGTHGVDWNFAGGLGTYGPFVVTQPDPLWPQRTISVPSTVPGVLSGTGVDLYGQPEALITFPVTRLDVGYETDYVATQMILQLHVRHNDGTDELLWTQSRSGYRSGLSNILWPGQTILPTDAIYFRVAAVPEPSACLALLLPTVGLLWMRRRTAR